MPWLLSPWLHLLKTQLRGGQVEAFQTRVPLGHRRITSLSLQPDKRHKRCYALRTCGEFVASEYRNFGKL